MLASLYCLDFSKLDHQLEVAELGEVLVDDRLESLRGGDVVTQAEVLLEFVTRDRLRAGCDSLVAHQRHGVV